MSLLSIYLFVYLFVCLFNHLQSLFFFSGKCETARDTQEWSYKYCLGNREKTLQVGAGAWYTRWWFGENNERLPWGHFGTVPPDIDNMAGDGGESRHVQCTCTGFAWPYRWLNRRQGEILPWELTDCADKRMTKPLLIIVYAKRFYHSNAFYLYFIIQGTDGCPYLPFYRVFDRVLSIKFD